MADVNSSSSTMIIVYNTINLGMTTKVIRVIISNITVRLDITTIAEDEVLIVLNIIIRGIIMKITTTTVKRRFMTTLSQTNNKISMTNNTQPEK